ncbi:hypothetical protein ES332_D03G173900v1 [Gossypium tomentosum]|uniref:Uncharacterized protein n=1 Tax=Gossypium tomentosum TaxID=34277 RepID=A0A5D2LS18_GOSTO|nr:hypothetical protein ES332_D03G173900v1 [Gossypium tomentosum]
MFHTRKKIYKSSPMKDTAPASFRSSPSMDPSSSQSPAPAELALTHGEIWLLIIVLLFAIFFTYILFCPRTRCSRSSESEALDSDNIPQWRNCLLVPSKSRSRNVTGIENIVEEEEEEEEDYSRQINEKYPL